MATPFTPYVAPWMTCIRLWAELSIKQGMWVWPRSGSPPGQRWCLVCPHWLVLRCGEGRCRVDDRDVLLSALALTVDACGLLQRCRRAAEREKEIVLTAV
eukprot:398053-Amphidinium_carterae.1